jgi:hypothetical protein
MMSEEGRPEHPPAPPADVQPGEPERSGPLILERHRKPDGRLLILYRAAGGEPTDGVGANAAENR